MSGKVKQRAQANLTDDLLISTNEKILKECHSLYADPNNGLLTIGESVGLSLTIPRRKITVMLMGNHSAGKSSFINWYIEEHVQRTGVAIETQGFSVVTSGRKRESLTGNATLHLMPHLQPLQEIDGVVDYLCTEVSTSKQKKFPLVSFLDTPGLVDGDMKYPFDVNEAILWLGDHCDLILVFFDPIGQALCKRTLDIVERLNQRHPDRIKFFLSKADEAGHESDRQRVMMQIVQELCKRPGLNKTGFDMPTIHIPNSNKQTRCANQIEQACKDIEKTIDQTIQSTLNQLEKDCDKISGLIDSALQADNDARIYNRKAKIRAMGLSSFGFLLPVTLILQLLVASAPRSALINVVGPNLTEYLVYYMSPLTSFWSSIGSQNELMALCVVLVISAVCLVVSRVTCKSKPCLQKKSSKALLEKRTLVREIQKNNFYSEYLKQSVAEDDL